MEDLDPLFETAPWNNLPTYLTPGRVLRDLQSTNHFCGRVIRHHPHPPLPSLCAASVHPVQLTDEKE
jgi:hypothetical protein